MEGLRETLIHTLNASMRIANHARGIQSLSLGLLGLRIGKSTSSVRPAVIDSADR
jgi:hypothetical protein